MAEPAESRESNDVCPRCGADVRENTSFCYSCGADLKDRLPATKEEPPTESEKALEDLAQKLNSKPDGDVLAKAAAERKKARVGQRKSRQYVWEPSETPRLRLLFLIATIFLALAALAVYSVMFVR